MQVNNSNVLSTTTNTTNVINVQVSTNDGNVLNVPLSLIQPENTSVVNVGNQKKIIYVH